MQLPISFLVSTFILFAGFFFFKRVFEVLSFAFALLTISYISFPEMREYLTSPEVQAVFKMISDFSIGDLLELATKGAEAVDAAKEAGVVAEP